MFKVLGGMSFGIAILILSQLSAIDSDGGAIFLAILVIVFFPIGLGLLQLPSELTWSQIQDALDSPGAGPKSQIQTLEELASTIRQEGLLAAESLRKTIKDPKLSYLVQKTLEGHEFSQVIAWIHSAKMFRKDSLRRMDRIYRETIPGISMAGLMSSLLIQAGGKLSIGVMLLPFMISVILHFSASAIWSGVSNQTEEENDVYFDLLHAGLDGIRLGVSSDFLKEQLQARIRGQ